jgi:hypothetical protein
MVGWKEEECGGMGWNDPRRWLDGRKKNVEGSDLQ